MDVVTIIRAAERLIVVSLAPLLVVLGFRLFVMGVTGQMKLSAKASHWQGTLTNMTPGAFCFLLGAALAAYVLFSRVPVTPSAAGAKPEVSGNLAAPTWMGGGGGNGTALSILLRRGISDLHLCETETISASDGHCRAEFDRKYKLPTSDELRLIEDTEQRLASNPPPGEFDRYVQMKRAFVK